MNDSIQVFLASPANQLQAHVASGMPVLVSFAVSGAQPWLQKGYLQSFEKVLVDSGAFSQFNSGKEVELSEYVAWAESIEWAENWASLDDISGDFRRGMRNLEAGGFPTFHDSDPPELLPELIDIARERGSWLGIGLVPPRVRRDDFLERTLEQVPDDIHVHGWALGAYALDHNRIDSFDSTHWWREAMRLRTTMPWLSYGETLEIMVKKIKRIKRRSESIEDSQQDLFA